MSRVENSGRALSCRVGTPRVIRRGSAVRFAGQIFPRKSQLEIYHQRLIVEFLLTGSECWCLRRMFFVCFRADDSASTFLCMPLCVGSRIKYLLRAIFARHIGTLLHGLISYSLHAPGYPPRTHLLNSSLSRTVTCTRPSLMSSIAVIIIRGGQIKKNEIDRSCWTHGGGAYKVLVGKPEGRRTCGISRPKWEDNIKIYL